jgi:hypothetical protein
MPGHSPCKREGAREGGREGKREGGRSFRWENEKTRVRQGET